MQFAKGEEQFKYLSDFLGHFPSGEGSNGTSDHIFG